MLVQSFTSTWRVTGIRLFNWEKILVSMDSTRDEFSSVSDSSVFRPFSLKHSIMFQMSTISTVKHRKYHVYHSRSKKLTERLENNRKIAAFYLEEKNLQILCITNYSHDFHKDWYEIIFLPLNLSFDFWSLIKAHSLQNVNIPRGIEKGIYCTLIICLAHFKWNCTLDELNIEFTPK